MKTCFKCGESLDEDQFYKHPAMADGRLGKCKEAQAHHEDYTKPFDVVWLCTKHHAERHRELRRIERLAIAEKEWCNGW